MALCSIRLRRALTLSSSLINHHRPFSSIPAISGSPSLSSLTPNSQNRRLDPSLPRLLGPPFHSRPFISTAVSLARPRSFDNGNSEIGPDSILFEGCDYNHWLITMDFPKDPEPTSEVKVETYVQTAAKVFGSVEEAKKRIYACSTSTYHGFQVEASEEMSEKFRGLPGVVFILPDSYIDPVNKEYGGDKYINGTIIPRPPPVRYGRQWGRFNDRNRGFDRRPSGPAPNQQGNSAYDNRGSMRGETGTYGPQRNFTPQQNYVPAGPGERRGPMPLNNAPVGRDTYQGDRRDSMPSYQANNNQGGQGNYHPQGQRDFPPGNQGDHMPPEQRDFRGDNRNYSPSQGGTIGQGASGTHIQGASGPYMQGPGGTQGVGGSPGQEMDAGYGQSYPRHGGDQRFSQPEQRNHAAMEHTWTDQVRYLLFQLLLHKPGYSYSIGSQSRFS
ncbi:multiple organellar RNA editing factor 1, mitochondrial-like [Cornus florida]|uniref:multiple organellar RNA editing factor 1, mitochondrial-like n=1 Tax=Cornus florida TaxID=4283 RepID=UPI00289AB0ED|nr:multiple organellar RNA editing factor 1, mitochondrial-like [Cornus florida]